MSIVPRSSATAQNVATLVADVRREHKAAQAATEATA